MSAVWFKIVTKAGAEHVGVVQGSGGKIGYAMSHLHPRTRRSQALRRMRRFVELADEGEALPCFEPKKGHVALYPDYCAAGDGKFKAVSLRGAKVELAKGPRRRR